MAKRKQPTWLPGNIEYERLSSSPDWEHAETTLSALKKDRPLVAIGAIMDQDFNTNRVNIWVEKHRKRNF